MHITFSKSAVQKLSPYLGDGTKRLKLLHDMEGCGCVVSGVPALQLIDGPSVDDKLAEGDPLPFYYEPRHEVYYEPKLKIDYDEGQGSFSLKSDGQIYTTHLRLIV
ncbi:iron-sulfur cluster biosynthesis family protein [Paenibacillus arenilitoris]|uniref:Iron-sulfur cluster biosynthesis family protein n=1 Tax=Paenibacillus arenilitoris TaxID=2772299 RepID=A0A927H7R3_9BACL|nr:iron-sulfur cluster biosynthesis family protein [Paenibacillus arenilitoris]MBD2869854.1 iron-sulfur cluster biosynthesis family protein [Paenibacillus arenilitoris]